MVQSSVDMLEKETVELPIDEVLTSMHAVNVPPVAQAPEVEVRKPREEENPYSYRSDDTMEVFRQKVEIRVEKEEEEEEEVQPQPKKEDKVPEKAQKKDKKGWDKKIERTIFDFKKK